MTTVSSNDRPADETSEPHHRVRLPHIGTGERAARRRQRQAAAPPPARPPEAGGGPRWGRAEISRYSFIGAMVVLTIAVPTLTFIGGKAVLRSNAGRQLNVVTNPHAPGYEATVEPTPTLMIADVDAGGKLSGVTLVALTTAGGG